jgi:hypothetical protein
MKNCRVCEVPLSKDNCGYYRLRNYIYLCNICNREQKRKWAFDKYKKNSSVAAKRVLDWTKENSLKNPVKHKCSQMYSSSRKRAKILNISHDINSTYLISIAPQVCPILNIKLDYLSKEKSKNSPSLDRINPDVGYIVGNVHIISYLANLMKSNATTQELISFGKWCLSLKL